MNGEKVTLPETACYKRHAEIDNHISEGKGWRSLMITLALSMVIQICAFCVLWGRLTQMVEINTNRITSLESLFPRQGNQGNPGEIGPQGPQGERGLDGK